MNRQLKREVKIGNITIGGNHPIAVQTMLNVPVKDIAGNVAQAQRVADAAAVLKFEGDEVRPADQVPGQTGCQHRPHRVERALILQEIFGQLAAADAGA